MMRSKIPVVDFSNTDLKAGTTTWLATRNKVRHALGDHGCVEIHYTQILPELRNSVFSIAEELFHLPIDLKRQNRHKSNLPFFGYYSHPSVPRYESLSVNDPTTDEGIQSFANLVPPQTNDQFCKSTKAISEILVELYENVMRMICESFKLTDDYSEKLIGNVEYAFRYYGYRKAEENETKLSLPAHTDKSWMSILHQNKVGGLKVKLKDGEWCDVEPLPSSFLVVIGETLMAWSNDWIPAGVHQVVVDEEKERFSVALSGTIKGTLHVPMELVDDTHPLRYKPFDTLEFFKNCLTNESSNINNYCGL